MENNENNDLQFSSYITKFDEMIEQLVDIMQDKEKYVDNDDIIAKDVKALKYAIVVLKGYRQKIDEHKHQITEYKHNIDLKNNELYVYKNLIYDYRKMIDFLIEKDKIDEK